MIDYHFAPFELTSMYGDLATAMEQARLVAQLWHRRTSVKVVRGPWLPGEIKLFEIVWADE
ncbi:hypothetical protein [Rhodococcoides fascians]|uniref:hypothetical protein n=1 Tax=Rhodococcoides fascians TaxID=1828 RepID=UPI000561D57C|nr:hypothetical protein [Rhodococcus fascians]